MLIIVCCSLVRIPVSCYKAIFSQFQSNADSDKGKKNNSKTRKDKKKDDDANSSSPSKKLQWSPGSFSVQNVIINSHPKNFTQICYL